MLLLFIRCQFTIILSISILAACQEPQTYDRRVTAANGSGGVNSNNRFGDGNDLDPNDPCGAEKAFGYAFQGSEQTGAYIVGGRVATTTDLVTRSTVKVHLGAGHCSGTLIGPNHVVTAAHCFQDATSASQVRLGFGENGNPDLNIAVTGFVVHPKYEGIFGTENGGYLERVFYDVAVISFEGDVSNDYYPVVVGDSSKEAKPGSSVLVAGYGAYFETDRRVRPLSLVETEVGDLLTDLREIQLSGGEGKGACYGDSGGPTYTLDSRRSCLKVVGTTTGPGRNSDYTCEYGSGTMMDITTYKGWMKCAFEDLNYPLTYLADDASRSDCSLNTPIF
ncbi:MAG: S1 family peptidase [Oligoflexus sp.]